MKAVRNVVISGYSSQCSGQTERFNRTILQTLRHYVADYPQNWNLYADFLSYVYNTQLHRAMKCALFVLVL